MKVLAIDPGELVGWAVGEVLPDKPVLVRHGITPLKDFAVKFTAAFSSYDEVVYENYRLIRAKNREGSEMPTSQLIGMIRLASWLHPDVHLVKQTPNNKNAINKVIEASDHEEFKDLIAREPGVHDDAHDIDAIRHLYYRWWKRHVEELTDGE